MKKKEEFSRERLSRNTQMLLRQRERGKWSAPRRPKYQLNHEEEIECTQEALGMQDVPISYSCVS